MLPEIAPHQIPTAFRTAPRAAPKALAIGIDAGGDRASGLRAFDHDHTHVSLPWIWFLKQETGRLDRPSCRCGYLGGIAHLPLIKHGGFHARGGTCSNRPGGPLEVKL